MESKYKLRLIEKHGIEIGTKMYDNWYTKICKARKNQYDEKYYIKKYGKIEGLKKLEEFKNKTSGSKNRYIKKYGKIEGLKKYNEFRNKCSIFNQNENSIKKYKNRKNVLSFEYFLNKENGDYIKASLLYKDRQNTSSLEKMIKKHGETDGNKKYKEANIKRLQKWSGKSKLEENFIEELIKMLKNKENIYYGDNKYMFFTNSIFRKKHNKKVLICDLYIKDLNINIEINGDFWHLNPLLYESNFYSKLHKKLAIEVWDDEAHRIAFLKEKYNIRTIVIWESEINKNKKKILKEISEEINGLY